MKVDWQPNGGCTVTLPGTIKVSGRGSRRIMTFRLDPASAFSTDFTAVLFKNPDGQVELSRSSLQPDVVKVLNRNTPAFWNKKLDYGFEFARRGGAARCQADPVIVNLG